MPLASVGTIGAAPGDNKPDLADERKAFNSLDTKTPAKGKTNDSTDDTTADEEVAEEEVDESAADEEAGEADSETTDEEEKEEEAEEAEEDTEEDEELASDSLYQQLKKRDPKLLKEMPELRQVIFREQQFTELYHSVEEAKEAKEAADTFQTFQRDIESGNSETLLEALSGKTLESFVANFIPTLEKKSKDLYFGILYPEFKKLLRAAAAGGDERLVASAKNLNWFLWNDQDLAKDEGLKAGENKKDEKADALTERERAFEKRQFESFATDIADVAEKRATRTILSAFKDSGLSQFMQNTLTEKIFQKVDAAIAGDKRHMGNVNSMWMQAKKAGFTTEWKNRLITAYLSRAQVLIPKIRQQILAEAKVSAKLNSGEVNKKKPIRVAPGSSSVSRHVAGTKIDSKKVDWNKADERAMLDGNVPLKG